jgi:alkaline phosphatase D
MSDDKKGPGSSGRTRRDFLRVGAATAAGAALLRPKPARGSELLAPDPLPDDVRQDEARFPLGVAAGDVRTDRAVLWTLYEGDKPLRLVVWQAREARLVEVFRKDLTPGARGPLHVDVTRLRPGAAYRYAFFELEGGKPVSHPRVGRFRTPPPADALVPITVGATACTRNGWDFSALKRASERDDLDLFIHLGDTAYCDGARSLEDFRGRWRENLSTEEYRALRASTSVLATWDDHEVTNDWLPGEIDGALVTRGRQCFFEHHPLGRERADRDRIWRRRRWGRTLDVFVIDSRSERSRDPKDGPRYLGREQMQWLKDGLKSSDAVFKLVVNSVPIGRFPMMFTPNRAERWESYPRCRDEILSWVDGNGIGGVVWLAGDFHLASVGRVSPDGYGFRSLEVLAGPGAQWPNLRAAWLRGRQFDWASGVDNYASLAFDPRTGAVRVQHFDKKGRVVQDSQHRVA